MPRYSFSGNICFKFSAFCLCSAYQKYLNPSGDPVPLNELSKDRLGYRVMAIDGEGVTPPHRVDRVPDFLSSRPNQLQRPLNTQRMLPPSLVPRWGTRSFPVLAGLVGPVQENIFLSWLLQWVRYKRIFSCLGWSSRPVQENNIFLSWLVQSVWYKRIFSCLGWSSRPVQKNIFPTPPLATRVAWRGRYACLFIFCLWGCLTQSQCLYKM